MNKKIVIIGAGVAGINAATKLIDNGYPGNLITVIDKGQDPYNRKHEEVMEGFLGCGGWSDGKLTYHSAIGGQLSKYCGEEKAMDLMYQVIENFKRFHPCPEVIMKSDPQEEPEFIKPHFGLRLFPVYHIGSNYLHSIACRWYEFLLQKGVNFIWDEEVVSISFTRNFLIYNKTNRSELMFDELIFAVGKSGINFSQKLIKQYNLETEAKSVQIGVRFEAPQHYFQKLIDISYDFKLYQKFDKVSLRSFCTNNNASYIAVEQTYGDISYNGHALKDEKYNNQMTNFGILMEIKGIEKPFEWCREIVNKVQYDTGRGFKSGMYYSPNQTRQPSLTSEGEVVKSMQHLFLTKFKEAFGEYADYILNFIEKMNEVFNFGDDWGIYIPEVKYLSEEPLVNYKDLSLINYPNIHFAGDALSARGISVSGAQGILIASSILDNIY